MGRLKRACYATQEESLNCKEQTKENKKIQTRTPDYILNLNLRSSQIDGKTVCNSCGSDENRTRTIQQDMKTLPECPRKVKGQACPRGFDNFFHVEDIKNGSWMSSCYRRVDMKSNWVGAETGCSMNGRLVSIESFVEQKHLESIFSLAEGDTGHWTSGSDEEEEGKWKWTSTGEPINYYNWHPGEPNGPLENFILISSPSALWYDMNKAQFRYYICEVHL